MTDQLKNKQATYDSSYQEKQIKAKNERVVGGNKERRALGKSIVYGTNPQA